MLAFWQWLFTLWSLVLPPPASRPAPQLQRFSDVAGEMSRTRLAASCAACHADEVKEWRSSRHALAFTNGLFRAEFDSRRTAWCASCHAPAAQDPRHVEDSDPLAQEGVGCMACHLDAEGRLVSRARSLDSPHQTLASESFGSDAFCGACHEFKYPRMGEDGMPIGYQDLAMQETVSQFRATALAAKGGQCTDCHMRASRGPHRFVGSHDEEMLRGALHVDACVEGGSLRIGIANVGAAHAVPTGGVNRHIVLRSWRSTKPAEMREFFIGRRFAGSEEGKVLVEDSSLEAGESRAFALELRELGGDSNEAVNVELRYVYPLDEFAPLAPGTRRYAIIWRQRLAAREMPCEAGT